MTHYRAGDTLAPAKGTARKAVVVILEDLGAKLFVGIIIAVVTAIVAVRLSLRRFYKERWWEKKSEAYEAILESLHFLKRYYEEEMDAVYEDREIGEEKGERLGKLSNDGWNDLLRRYDVARYVISEGAYSALQDFRAKFDAAKHTAHWSEFLDNRLGALQEIMDTITAIARRDLELR